MPILETQIPPVYDETAALTISRLVEICHRCEQIFARTVLSAACSEFRGGVGRVREVLNQFGFQLRAELRRIEPGQLQTIPLADNLIFDAVHFELSLGHVLESYQYVLDRRLPPHTHAMVKRQYEQLQQVSDELNRFVEVLQRLIEKRPELTA